MAQHDPSSIRAAAYPVHRVTSSAVDELIREMPDATTVTHVAHAPARNFSALSEKWRTTQQAPSNEISFLHPGLACDAIQRLSETSDVMVYTAEQFITGTDDDGEFLAIS